MTNAAHDTTPRTNLVAGDPFEMQDLTTAAAAAEPLVHKLRKGVRCGTERRGYTMPRGESPVRLVLDASEGFIPLWAPNTTLRWRFQERSMRYFRNPGAAKAAIEQLMTEAVVAWGDATPVRFTKDDDVWDFEVVMNASDDCDGNGCVLASAFFPDSGRHELQLYPKMFTQTRAEQVETLVHEVGHIFGLRHFFAQIQEQRWPSEIFGKHVEFSIMNYGDKSRLTDADKSDLKKLYRAAWIGQLTQINNTPIRLVHPFHEALSFGPNDSLTAVSATRGVCPQLATTIVVIPQGDGATSSSAQRSAKRDGKPHRNGATERRASHR